MSVGFDHLDLETLKGHGIKVTKIVKCGGAVVKWTTASRDQCLKYRRLKRFVHAWGRFHKAGCKALSVAPNF